MAKDSLFLVVKGLLRLVRYECGRSAVSIDLAPGDPPQIIPAQLEHRFIILEQRTVAYEIYWAASGGSIDPDDIVRRDEGGCLPMVFEGSSGNPGAGRRCSWNDELPWQ